jgi:hypothetical protein
MATVRGALVKKHLLAILGYVVATFVTQAISHFVLFKDHYAAVPYLKAEPVFALGFLSMIVQGTILSVVYAGSRFRDGSMLGAMKLSWLLGAFLVSYIGLAEAAKYTVPAIPSWIGVEFLSGAIQFTLAGAFLALSHRLGSTTA